MFVSSPIEEITFEGKPFFLKRDDLLDKDFSGNKARKFYYYLQHDFPSIHTLISYGSAQSNAMYSLSVLAKRKGWKFEYYVEHIASYLEENPHGNYLGALNNGMKLCLGKPPSTLPKEVLFIDEGGRGKEAEFGIKILAQEILAWQKENNVTKLNIFLPSGTGTTALFLQKNLQNIQVYTCPCVGNSDYLLEQFLALESNKNLHPQILSLEKKHHFGKLYKENYVIWLKLQAETKVKFDLLYDPLGWRTLLHHLSHFKTPILYIHQGGLLGNESMLARYERKYSNL